MASHIVIEYDMENARLRTSVDSPRPEFVYSTSPTVEIRLLGKTGAAWTSLPSAGSAMLSIANDWTRSTQVCGRKTISFSAPTGGVFVFPDMNLNTAQMSTATDNNTAMPGFVQLRIYETGITNPVRIVTFDAVLINILDGGDPGVVPDPSPESYYLPRAEALANFLQDGGEVTIGAGVKTVAVVFPVELDAAPKVPVVSVGMPDAFAPFITAAVDLSSLTATGFTAVLSATTGATGYKLGYVLKR